MSLHALLRLLTYDSFLSESEIHSVDFEDLDSSVSLGLKILISDSKLGSVFNLFLVLEYLVCFLLSWIS